MDQEKGFMAVSVLAIKLHSNLGASKAKNGGLVCAGVVKDELVGPCQVDNGLKLSLGIKGHSFEAEEQNKCFFFFLGNHHFIQGKSLSQTLKSSTAVIIIMTFEPSQLNLNPRKMCQVTLKWHISTNLKNFSEKCSSKAAATQKVDHKQIKKLTDFMDEGLKVLSERKMYKIVTKVCIGKVKRITEINNKTL